MDQLKDILKQLIRYRFWIAVGVSAILPIVAYYAGAGPIKERTLAEEGTIKGVAAGVKGFTSGSPVNAQYASTVTEKTGELVKDVDKSWSKLYDRQKDLLTWPEIVQERFTAWGRQWPKETDPSAVQVAIINYIDAYPKFVTDVYKSFQPFDPVEGTGIVSAPPEEALLRPLQFSESNPPGLGKVWAAQERLWIQRTLLDVVAKVNKDAKSWDDAIIKQINAMEVGNAAAQDQRSVAKAEPLEEAPNIVDPAAPAAPAAPTDPSGAGAAGGGAPGGSGAGGGMGEAPPGENAGAVYYIKSDSPAFKILPVQMTVLIDQDHIQDFLVALENSPMNIQVRDFEMFKPTARVTKPEKGSQTPYGGEGMGSFGMTMAPSIGTMTGYGGRMMEISAAPGASGGGPSAGPAQPAHKGVDKRLAGESREAALKKAIETAKKAKTASLHDPYYNIVEVKVYGQARFFNPPPAPPDASPSTAATPAPTPATDAATAAPAADAEKKAEPAAEKKDAAPAEKKAEPARDADEPKADAKKADEPKAEPAKPEADAKKADEPAPAPK